MKPPTIQKFLTLQERSSWCREGVFKIYMRKAVRFIDGEKQTALDVANIESTKLGSGKLPALFDQIECLSREGFSGVYVENVLNERLRVWLEDRSYRKLPNPCDLDDLVPCYWKTFGGDKAQAVTTRM